MAVCWERDPSGHSLLPGAECLSRTSPVEFRDSDANCLEIGLVNNMPDAALEATERQFRALLDAAADGIVVRLTLYGLPDVPRAEWGRRHVSSFYAGIGDLWDRHHDGLIVTGTEPRSKEGGVDAFIKLRRSLFVFFQGHPEYEANTLLLEYRRDVKRFLRGERETYPPMPRGYFDEETVGALTAVRARALSERREGLLEEFPSALLAGRVTNTWRPAAARVYRNWLLYLCAQKDRRLKRGRVESGVHG